MVRTQEKQKILRRGGKNTQKNYKKKKKKIVWEPLFKGPNFKYRYNLKYWG